MIHLIQNAQRLAAEWLLVWVFYFDSWVKWVFPIFLMLAIRSGSDPSFQLYEHQRSLIIATIT